MHIILVSSTKKSFLSTELFQNLHDITLHEVARLENLPNTNKQLEVVFFDAALGMEDITQQTQLYQQKHPTKWLVINAPDIQQSIQYLQLGASGILTQPSEQTVEDCLQSISRGQLYLEANFIQILALRQIKKTLLPFKPLTAREYDVFCLLAEDYSIQIIARLLSVSTKTAFNCQAQIRRKLGLSNQQGIFEFAKKNGLIY